MTKKKKNEGFTLVELVIAVVILAIAVSPLVSNFIQSSRMNLKSRKALNAMNLAQDIMEGMSQYSVSDNTTYFNTATTNPGSLADVRILPGGTTVGSCTAVSTDPQKYIYTIGDIKTTSGNYNSYDVKVTFNAGDAGSELEAINSQNIADIKGIDNTKDVVYTLSSSMTTAHLTDMRDTMSTEPARDISTYTGHVVRSITLNFKKQEEGLNTGIFKYECEVIVEYTAPNYLGYTTGNNTKIYTDTATMASTKDMPRSFYLYYAGLPGAKRAGSVARENIYIVNKTGEPITVYLVRTVDSEIDANGNIIVKEDETNYNRNYACDVNIKGYKSTNGYSVAEASRIYQYEENVDLVSNLRMNLKETENNRRVYEEGTSNLLPGISVEEAAATNYSRDRSRITYNSSSVNEAMYKEHISDGYLQSNKKLLYKVTVEISESGSSNVMATYTGGLSN